jgi:hypothetical protein
LLGVLAESFLDVGAARGGSARLASDHVTMSAVPAIFFKERGRARVGDPRR